MKSKHDFRKPGKAVSSSSDEIRRATKLKPVAKEKNLKRSFFDEIEEEDDLEEEVFDNDEFLDDDDDAYDEEEEEEEEF